MTDQNQQDTEKPQQPPKKRHRVVKVLILMLGMGFLGWEFYVLTPGVRVAVVNVLGWIGPSTTPLVLSFCEDDSRDVRDAAVQVMRQSGAEAVPFLEQSLTDPDARRRQNSAEVLGLLGPAAAKARPALIEAGLKDRDSRVRLAALDALSIVGEIDQEIVQGLINLLEDRNAQIRLATADLLGKLGAKASASVPALARRLKDENAKVRQEAAEALGSIGPAAKQAIQALREARMDPDLMVRQEVEEALEAISPSAHSPK